MDREVICNLKRRGLNTSGQYESSEEQRDDYSQILEGSFAFFKNELPHFHVDNFLIRIDRLSISKPGAKRLDVEKKDTLY